MGSGLGRARARVRFRARAGLVRPHVLPFDVVSSKHQSSQMAGDCGGGGERGGGGGEGGGGGGEGGGATRQFAALSVWGW